MDLDNLIRFQDLTMKVRALALSDAEFEAAVVRDPLGAVKARFGADALPGEGEYVREKSDGTREIVFPVSGLYWTLGSANHAGTQDGGELSDEMLEAVSGGGFIVKGPNGEPL